MVKEKMATRIRIQINGCIQGVGFRPHAFRIAKKLALSGWVKNHSGGVAIEVQGTLTHRFIPELIATLPPLAKINIIQQTTIDALEKESEFIILESETSTSNTLTPPDTVTCKECLNELFDSNNRFHRYPFLNCTLCGPRITIIEKIPYDRKYTSMNCFPLCAACEKDYSHANNRRHHAQGIACENCGPHLSTPIHKIIDGIKQGKIVALKGLGGYQFICNARDEIAVSKLRLRKQRPNKPLALMAANLASIHQIAEADVAAEKLLSSSIGPIVLLRKKPSDLATNIAPNLSFLGVMLPTTPLHHLIFSQWPKNSHLPILVVTSGNIHDHPLLTDDTLAEENFKNIADMIISYNREIIVKLDDSVVQVINHAPLIIRRARGYVPIPIQLSQNVPQTLALGGYLKNTFCITRGNEAFLSQHIGDLKNPAMIDFFHDSLTYWLKFLNVKPERIIYDSHPDFYTSRLANEYHVPTFSVQHHHAHLAAVAAEYHIEEAVLGLALDGHGYGLNGEPWGGELLLLNQIGFERLAHLKPLPMPGGEKAAHEPWRMAAGVLFTLNKIEEISKRFSQHANTDLITLLLSKKINSPLTSSCGRLFDAAAALLGIQTHNQYQGQAAMELESLANSPIFVANGWLMEENSLNLLPILSQLLELDPITGANVFHGTLINALTDLVYHWAQKTQIKTILLSGGCFSNKILSEGLIATLEKKGLKPLLPTQAPPNDGGISLGQAWIGSRFSALPRIAP